MAHFGIVNLLSLTLLLSTSFALPFNLFDLDQSFKNKWPFHYHERAPQRYDEGIATTSIVPTDSINPINTYSDVITSSDPSSSQTFSATPTQSLPSDSPSLSSAFSSSQVTVDPVATGTSPGTATFSGTATGTGLPQETARVNLDEVQAFADKKRRSLQGPRRLRFPHYYPIIPAYESNSGTGSPTLPNATATTGGVPPTMAPTGRGTSSSSSQSVIDPTGVSPSLTPYQVPTASSATNDPAQTYYDNYRT